MPATTTYASTGNAYIDGVLGDVKWAVNEFTFSFPTSGSFYGSRYGSGEPTNNFGTLNAAQQAAARATFDAYASVANLKFTEIAETSTQHADLRLAMSDAPSTAWAYLPSTAAEGGDVWFNKSSGYYSNPVKGNYAYATFLHETGHALGLEHAHEAYVMPLDRDSMEYTVMSYRSYVGASLGGGYTNEKAGYAQSLMMYDIAALQHMYGADYTANGGDTRYSWSTATGEMLINGVSQGAPGANRIFLTVWDGGGNDTYDFGNYTTDLKVDLRPGGWTTTSSTQLAKLHYDGSKVAAGNIANALLHNNDGRSLVENAIGGSGDDVIFGNSAANSLLGGAGNDRLYGLQGDDRLVCGIGNDIMDGGGGIDCASFEGIAQNIVVRLGFLEGLDTGAGIKWLWNIEGLIGGSGNDRLVGDAGNNRLDGGLGNDVLDGGSGIDTVTFESVAQNIIARLGYMEGLDTGVGIKWIWNTQNLTGGSGNDYLFGDAGPNQLEGGAGNDVLVGGGGADILVGGDAGDRFVFQFVNDSLPGVRDTILDFTSGPDAIDLTAIDANSKLAGDQAFTFLGDSRFTGRPGELNFRDGIVSADVDGDGVADFQIEITNVPTLIESDFYL